MSSGLAIGRLWGKQFQYIHGARSQVTGGVADKQVETASIVIRLVQEAEGKGEGVIVGLKFRRRREEVGSRF